MTDAPARLRIDKWLWQARFFKTRTLAARVVGEAGVRVNGERVTRTSHAVAPGDVLTFAQGTAIRVVAVVALGTRRGPAAEAQALYEDRSPAPAPRAGPRPTGRDRRKLDALREEAGE